MIAALSADAFAGLLMALLVAVLVGYVMVWRRL